MRGQCGLKLTNQRLVMDHPECPDHPSHSDHHPAVTSEPGTRGFLYKITIFAVDNKNINKSKGETVSGSYS